MASGEKKFESVRFGAISEEQGADSGFPKNRSRQSTSKFKEICSKSLFKNRDSNSRKFKSKKEKRFVSEGGDDRSEIRICGMS